MFGEIDTKNILGYVSEDNPLRDTAIWHIFFPFHPLGVPHHPLLCCRALNKSLRQKITNAIFLFGSVIFLLQTSGERGKLGTVEKARTVPKWTGDY